MKLLIFALLISFSASAQRNVQLVGNRERIKHYVPNIYRLVRESRITKDGNPTEVPVNEEIGMTISNKAVAYVLSETEVDVKSYKLTPVKIQIGDPVYSFRRVGNRDRNEIVSWSIDGWVPRCIKNDTLLMSREEDDVLITRYWKRR